MRPLTVLPLDPTNATARGACAERSEMGQPVCGSLAVTPQLRGSSGCRVRAPAPPAVGRSRSGSCDCIPVTAAYRGLVIGGRASACRVPDSDIPTAVTDRDPHVMSRRWRLFALGFHGTARWDRHGAPGSRAVTGEVSHTRAESGAPGQALRSRDSMCGRAVPRGVPPACRAIARDPTCTACRGDGLGVRLRRRRTQAHDEMPPRRAVREGPIFAHGVRPGGNGASPPHRTWPSRSPCRRSSDLHPARSSTGSGAPIQP